MDNQNKSAAMVVYSHYSRDARVRRYAECLASNGHRVDIICLNEKYNPKNPGINLIKFPFERSRAGVLHYVWEYLLFFVYAFIKISILSLSRKYSVIHVHNMPDFLVFAAVVPKLAGAKIILDIHDPMPELYASKFAADEKQLPVKILKIIENAAFRFSDRVITANTEFERLLESRNGKILTEKLSVILNSPDPRIFRPAKTGKFKKKGKFILFYMGTIDKRFGLHIPVYSMLRLKELVPGIMFEIYPKIGREGAYFNSIRDAIRDMNLEGCVRINSPVTLEQLPKLLTEADVGVVLAVNGVFTESIMPVKLMEFIQSGIPVIATRTKILSRYFTDKDLMFLKKNDVGSFVSSVLNLYKNRVLRERLAKNAKKYLRIHGWKSEEKKYRTIIRGLLKSGLLTNRRA